LSNLDAVAQCPLIMS